MKRENQKKKKKIKGIQYQCISNSSGRTGCVYGIIDFFSTSLDKALRISTKKKKQIWNNNLLNYTQYYY